MLCHTEDMGRRSVYATDRPPGNSGHRGSQALIAGRIQFHVGAGKETKIGACQMRVMR